MGRLIDEDFVKRRMHETMDYQDLYLPVHFEMCMRDAPTIAAPRWVRCEEPPKDGQECLVAYSGPTDWIYEHATYHSDLNKALEEDIFIDGTDGFIVDGDVGYDRHSFNYWMPIEPPKEDA